ncbi:MAG: hypothetical protein WCJ73_10900, partial [Actinomycetes bacterium]
GGWRFVGVWAEDREGGIVTMSSAQIAAAIGAVNPAAGFRISGWSIDSRTTQAGDCFFALRGAEQALEAVEVIRSSTNPLMKTEAIIINKARPSVAEQRQRIEELTSSYGSLVSKTLVPERNAIQQAEAAGVPIHAWESPAGIELAKIFDALYDVIMPIRFSTEVSR